MSRVWNRFCADAAHDLSELLFQKKTGRKLTKVLKKLSPDVIHAHLHVQNYLRWADIGHAKLYYTCHSEPYRYFSGKEGINTQYLVKKKGMKIIALHNDMKCEINSCLNICDTIVLKNWIDFSQFTDIKQSKAEIRRSFGLPEDAWIIGTVGRITEYKNQIFLVDILEKIGGDACLAIAGAGSEDVKRQILDKASRLGVEERIHFLGVINDVNKFYKAINVFALPSKFEGLGIVAVEAQVSGVKCLLSDAISKEVCLSNKTFFLPLTDSKVWADLATDDNATTTNYGDLSKYNLSLGIKELEKLYETSCSKENILNFN